MLEQSKAKTVVAPQVEEEEFEYELISEDYEEESTEDSSEEEKDQTSSSSTKEEKVAGRQKIVFNATKLESKKSGTKDCENEKEPADSLNLGQAAADLQKSLESKTQNIKKNQSTIRIFYDGIRDKLEENKGKGAGSSTETEQKSDLPASVQTEEAFQKELASTLDLLSSDFDEKIENSALGFLDKEFIENSEGPKSKSSSASSVTSALDPLTPPGESNKAWKEQQNKWKEQQGKLAKIAGIVVAILFGLAGLNTLTFLLWPSPSTEEKPFVPNIVKLESEAYQNWKKVFSRIVKETPATRLRTRSTQLLDFSAKLVAQSKLVIPICEKEGVSFEEFISSCYSLGQIHNFVSNRIRLEKDLEGMDKVLDKMTKEKQGLSKKLSGKELTVQEEASSIEIQAMEREIAEKIKQVDIQFSPDNLKLDSRHNYEFYYKNVEEIDTLWNEALAKFQDKPN